MFTIRPDYNKNRIYVQVKGMIEKEEAKSAADQVIEQMEKMKPGFDIITDISEFKTSPQESTVELARAQENAVRLNANRIVRVIGGQPIGQLQFERISKTTGTKAALASSVEEAEKFLDS